MIFQKKKTYAAKGRPRRKKKTSSFEWKSVGRLVQWIVAALLFYTVASLFALGTGQIGTNLSGRILSLLGGAVLLPLIHLFYALLCSALGRRLESPFRQWLGTIFLYLALTLLLTMMRRAGYGLTVGLLSSGFVGDMMLRVFHGAIGGFGLMVIGLLLVVFSAFQYGHLSTERVNWLRSQLTRFSLAPFFALFHGEKDDAALPDEAEAQLPLPVAESLTQPDDIPQVARRSKGFRFFKSIFGGSSSQAPQPDEAVSAEAYIDKESSVGPLRPKLVFPEERLAQTSDLEKEMVSSVDEFSEHGEPVVFPLDMMALAQEADSPTDQSPLHREEEPTESVHHDPSVAVEVGRDMLTPEGDHLKHQRTSKIETEKKTVVDLRASNQQETHLPHPAVTVDEAAPVIGTENVIYYGSRAIPAGRFPPPLDLLGPSAQGITALEDQAAADQGEEVIEALSNFGVTATLERTVTGPTVIQYQIQLAPGIKVSKVSALGDDIAVALAVPAVRVEAPIPGTTYVGIELPNAKRRAVALRTILESETFQKTRLHLPLPLGQTVDGRVLITGLEELPHLLVAGTTGSGKSIFINNCIAALCYHNSPADLRFIMVDPKRVEMGIYESLPHILSKPIVTPASAIHALAWAVREMERRYEVFSRAKARNLASYNEKILPKDKLPHIVVIVDELADLMMTAQKEVEEYIARLAQMARATGIHLILATQRPSVNVITGMIKANIPARVAFSLPSVADSRTILDVSGAQHLLGKGDMLFVSTRHPRPLRIQSPFMDESVNLRVVEYLRETFGDPEYVDLEEQGEGGQSKSGESVYLDDPKLEEAIQIVLQTGIASSSRLQRQMRVGFTRAARLIDTMEQMGIVGPADGARPREILVDEEGACDLLDRHREGS